MLARHWPLALFTAAYMIAFTIRAVRGGNTEFIFYAAIMVVTIALVLALHRRVGFSRFVLWGLAIWGLLHMAGGNIAIPPSLAPDWKPTPRPDGSLPVQTVLYNLRAAPWLPKFDQFVHAFGFFFATLASFQCLRAASRGALRATPGVATAALCMGMGLGALNEVVEFIATRFMATNVGGYVNTGWDLVSNLAGSALAAGLIVAQKCPAKDSNLQPSD